MTALWDVEFSLALHNRTGKYQIGQAILDENATLVADIYYWRQRTAALPTGVHAKVLGRLLQTELRLRRASRVIDRLPRVRSKRPMLHLDPFTVLLHAVTSDDLVLCHDLGPITHPDLFAPDVAELYRRAYGEIAEKRPGLVFVSEASRTAFSALYDPPERSEVIYPPIRFATGNTAGAAPTGVEGRFLLTVGSVGRRKNQAAVIKAFADANLAAAGIDYVICGSREPGYEEVAALAESTPGVRLLSFVSDAELAWLYGNAEGFVLVSNLEGFGMPVAEAIGYGLVPLVSGDSVLEEVAGEGALTADPGDLASTAAGLTQLCEIDDAHKTQRLGQLSAAIARFTPETFAENWRKVLSAPRPGPV